TATPAPPAAPAATSARSAAKSRTRASPPAPAPSGSAGPASLAADRISPCPCPLSLTSDMSVPALPVECQGEARRALAYYRYGPLPRLPASVRPRRPLLRRLRRGIIE